jgi:Ca2+-binding RTX toxin-like protein
MSGRKARRQMEKTMLYRTTFYSPTLTTMTISAPVDPNTINGTSLDDYFTGTSGRDFIYGYAGNDTLYGLGGDDIIDGGAGVDVMAGGTGNDIYYVDNINDVVWEWGGEGNDAVYATISNAAYTLPVAVEQLHLRGTSACDGYGNELDNSLEGNDAANKLEGGAGNDQLYGNGGNDNLGGGDGNDIIDGGAGMDFMRGGLGDDIYYVDTIGDYISDPIGGGIDTIRSVVGIQLFDNIENLELSEYAYNGFACGNNLNNVIRANSSSNEITGLGGADTLYGGAGTDTFKYISLTDSAPLGQGLTDYIADFNEAEGDRIDLSRIDANVNVEGNQRFLFIGNNNAFVESWGAGQLRFNGGFVEGDVNGDFVADFAIQVNASALTDFAFLL